MIKLSLSGFADYMTANPHRQRTVLHQYKYPNDDDARAKIMYYREARDAIRLFHTRPRGAQWLLDRADIIQLGADNADGARRTRLNCNARGLRSYARYFSARNFQILNNISLQLIYGDVRINVLPDLHVREGNREKIIKLDFSSQAPTEAEVDVVTQAMFEAARLNGTPLTSAGVLLFDVSRGREHRGARLGSRMNAQFVAACQTIEAIWATL